jgi:dihydrolipoamide dehydrogenase
LSESGFVKILIERVTKKIIGAHIVGPEASDMIHMLIAFMSKDGTLDDLLNMIYIHPALPEIVRNAARKAKSAIEMQMVKR